MQIVKILDRALAGTIPAEVDAPKRRRRCRAIIGRLAEMIGAGTRRIGADDIFQPLGGDEGFENPLGRRRAADISQADEKNPDHGWSYPRRDLVTMAS